eukprot:1256176-Rhodomonas_salina.1
MEMSPGIFEQSLFRASGVVASDHPVHLLDPAKGRVVPYPFLDHKNLTNPSNQYGVKWKIHFIQVRFLGFPGRNSYPVPGYGTHG